MYLDTTGVSRSQKPDWALDICGFRLIEYDGVESCHIPTHSNCTGGYKVQALPFRSPVLQYEYTYGYTSFLSEVAGPRLERLIEWATVPLPDRIREEMRMGCRYAFDFNQYGLPRPPS